MPRSDPRTILVIVTRQIGDVLVTTPLLRSLREGFAGAQIDVLVYRGTDGVLAGNPDIRRVIAVPERPSFSEYRAWLGENARRYDLALSVLAGDRPFAYAFLAARRRLGIISPAGHTGHWKRRFYADSVTGDERAPVLIQYLRLADRLGIKRSYEVVPPAPSPEEAEAVRQVVSGDDRPFAVLHLAPLRRYKRWTVAGWRALIAHLRARRVRVLVSGGPSAADRDYARAILGPESDATDLSGTLSFAQLAALLRRAIVYIGPDTSVTHLAAATGVPTIALFGPTDPTRWGPWPAGFAQDRSPYERVGALQQVGNVVLLQGVAPCVPCQKEGCEDHRESHSGCLDELPAARVIAALDRFLPS